MPLPLGKFVVSMTDPEMFIKTDIDQSIIAAPTIEMYHGIQSYYFNYNCGITKAKL